MEHSDSKNKTSLDPRLHSSSRGEGTPVPGQGVMKRQWGALLGLLCVQTCWVRGVKVEQSSSVLSLQEGANSTLRCNFSTSITYVQWFQQNPGGSLTTLFFIASGTKQNESLSPSPCHGTDLHSSVCIALGSLIHF
ncbi:hypothetical protein Celaphus_00006476, partial [Cervus elaphus hippelaphus]